MLGFTCQAVSGFTTFAPCLEHVCAGGGGGGSVENESFVLYIGGYYSLRLECYVLVQYVSRLVVKGTGEVMM